MKDSYSRLMKMDIYRYLRYAAVTIAAMFVSTDAMAEGDATFRWFEYCPGVNTEKEGAPKPHTRFRDAPRRARRACGAYKLLHRFVCFP